MLLELSFNLYIPYFCGSILKYISMSIVINCCTLLPHMYSCGFGWKSLITHLCFLHVYVVCVYVSCVWLVHTVDMCIRTICAYYLFLNVGWWIKIWIEFVNLQRQRNQKLRHCSASINLNLIIWSQLKKG